MPAADPAAAPRMAVRRLPSTLQAVCASGAVSPDHLGAPHRPAALACRLDPRLAAIRGASRIHRGIARLMLVAEAANLYIPQR